MTSTPKTPSERPRSLIPRLLPVCLGAGMMLAPAAAVADLAPPDRTPPKVSIKTPEDGLQLPTGTHQITVKVDARDPQTGVDKVVLKVDGKTVKKDVNPPFRFNSVELGPGRHELVAIATNYHDLRARSKPVVVVVAEPEPQRAEVVDPPEAEAAADVKVATDSRTEAKAELDARPEASAYTAKPKTATASPEADTLDEAKDGCFASVRPRSLLGSSVALLFAAFAGLMLRRRRS